jgi:protein-disulfide isomerase
MRDIDQELQQAGSAWQQNLAGPPALDEMLTRVPKRDFRPLVAGGIVALVMVLVGGAYLFTSPKSALSPAGGMGALSVRITQDAVIEVAAEGAVDPYRLDLWFDYQCPGCGLLGVETAELTQKLLYDKKIQFNLHPIDYLDQFVSGTAGTSTYAANALYAIASNNPNNVLSYHFALETKAAEAQEYSLTPADVDETAAAVGVPRTLIDSFAELEYAEQIKVVLADMGANGIGFTPYWQLAEPSHKLLATAESDFDLVGWLVRLDSETVLTPTPEAGLTPEPTATESANPDPTPGQTTPGVVNTPSPEPTTEPVDTYEIPLDVVEQVEADLKGFGQDNYSLLVVRITVGDLANVAWIREILDEADADRASWAAISSTEYPLAYIAQATAELEFDCPECIGPTNPKAVLEIFDAQTKKLLWRIGRTEPLTDAQLAELSNPTVILVGREGS